MAAPSLTSRMMVVEVKFGSHLSRRFLQVRQLLSQENGKYRATAARESFGGAMAKSFSTSHSMAPSWPPTSHLARRFRTATLIVSFRRRADHGHGMSLQTASAF